MEENDDKDSSFLRENEIAQNQEIRRRIINHLTTNSVGEFAVPEDKNERLFLAGILLDSDKAVLGYKRLKVADTLNRNNAKTVDLIGKILAQTKPQEMIDNTGTNKAPDIDFGPEKLELVEGELEQGVKSRTLDEFKRDTEHLQFKPIEEE